jgi:hypothetical protein
LQAEITGMVLMEISDRIRDEPQNWWRVSEAADLYVKYYNQVRNKRAANAILSPLNLTAESFSENQKNMSTDLVSSIAKELLNYEIPHVSAIFGGLDLAGAHIYTVYNNEANCVDNVGFASIGIGARHASSHFMFARHAWNSPFTDTLLLTYYAKRKSEVAPGVGRGTDILMVGPALGTLNVVGDHVIEKLEQEYSKAIRSRGFRLCAGKERDQVLC